MTKRTYVDSCLLIAAYQGTQDISNAALEILDDPERQFVVSSYLELELLPKPLFYSRDEEVGFMRQFFACASACIEPSRTVVERALTLAAKYDLAPIDALHVSAANAANVDELVTLEGATKPMLRVREVNVVSLRSLSIE